MSTVLIAISCNHCRGSGWLLWREGTSALELSMDRGHSRRQKRAGNFYVPRPDWHRRSEWTHGSGKRPTKNTSVETKTCFICKGRGEVPQKAKLYEE